MAVTALKLGWSCWDPVDCNLWLYSSKHVSDIAWFGPVPWTFLLIMTTRTYMTVTCIHFLHFLEEIIGKHEQSNFKATELLIKPNTYSFRMQTTSYWAVEFCALINLTLNKIEVWFPHWFRIQEKLFNLSKYLFNSIFKKTFQKEHFNIFKLKCTLKLKLNEIGLTTYL